MARKNERKEVAKVAKQATMFYKVPKGPPTSVKPEVKWTQMVKTVEEEKLHLYDPTLLQEVLKFYSEGLEISRMINENRKAREQDCKDNGTTTASLALRQKQQELSDIYRNKVTVRGQALRQRIKDAQALTVAAAAVPMAPKGVECSMSSPVVGANNEMDSQLVQSGYTSDTMSWLRCGADGGMDWHLSALRERWEDFCESDELFAVIAHFEAEMPACLEEARNVLHARDQCALYAKEVKRAQITVPLPGDEFLKEDPWGVE